MSVSTHASLIVKQLEFVEETTPGQMPTNPAMSFLAESAKLSYEVDVGGRMFRRHGSEDGYKYLQGKYKFKSTLEFGISNSTFIKYGINAIGGAGTIGKTLSLGMSYKLNDTENFLKLLGTRVNSIKLHGNPDNPEIKCTAEMVHFDIPISSTTDYIGTGSHASPSTSAPWVYDDGGADPITWGGVALPILDINVTISRAISEKHVMGQKRVKYQKPTNRQILGDCTVEWFNTTQESDMLANTERTLAWVLKSGVSTLTITNAVIKKLTGREFDADSEETMVEKYTIEGRGASVT